MTVAIFDIETDNLYEKASTLHCVSIKVDDAPTKVYTSRDIAGSNGSLDEALAILNSVDLVVGHNIINFDLPTMEKLGYKVTTDVHDTLIMSRLAFPNIAFQDANRKSVPPKLKGSHSLKAWGYRLRKLKGDFGETMEQWERLTPEMVEYCRQDTEVTHTLYHKLLDRNVPESAIQLEQRFADIMSRQEKFGVFFDVPATEKLHIDLLDEADKAEATLYETFHPLQTWTPKPYPKVPEKKDGTKSQVLLNQEALGCHFNKKGEWGYFKEVQFNPSSRQHIARWLSEVYGWKPKEYTDNGTPIINEKVLNSLDFPEGKVLAHYFNVVKLRGQLVDGKNAWMKMVGPDSRIHGRVNTLGAVSRRCTHSNPNMAQVPSPRAYRGKEARQLFSTPSGRKIVGCDLSGLELRVFAHYLARYDNGEYANVILNGDIHTYNQKGAGLSTRDQAKTFIYGVLYGAGDAKVGEIVGGTAEQGRVLKERFFRAVPAYKRLLDQVQATYKAKGTLLALDGNPYHIRSAHSALNTLLQGAGALIAKKWVIVADEMLSQKYTAGEQYEFILQVHDEVEIECDADIAEDVRDIVVSASLEAGERLKIRMPIHSEGRVGDTWYDVH